MTPETRYKFKVSLEHFGTTSGLNEIKFTDTDVWLTKEEFYKLVQMMGCYKNESVIQE